MLPIKEVVIGPGRHKQVSWASTWRLLENKYDYPVNPEGETDAEKVKVASRRFPFKMREKNFPRDGEEVVA